MKQSEKQHCILVFLEKIGWTGGRKKEEQEQENSGVKIKTLSTYCSGQNRFIIGKLPLFIAIKINLISDLNCVEKKT